MLRLSIDTPVASNAPAPGRRWRRRSRRRSTSGVRRPWPASSAWAVSVTSSNGWFTPATSWPCSWPLPATTSTSPSAQQGRAGADGLAAVAVFLRTRRGGQDGGADRGRLLERGLSSVTMATSARRAAISPISGRLPRSRSPPAPNTTTSLPPGVRTQGLPARSPGRRACGRSRHRPRRRARRSPTRCSRPAAPSRCSRAGRWSRPGPRRWRGTRPAATSTFEAWKAPASGSSTSNSRSLGGDLQALALRHRRALDQPQPLPFVADRQNGPARGDGGRGEGREGVAVGVQHGGAGARQQGLEQPQLGRAVAAHGAVIVQVVLGEVGEAGGRQAHAVQAPLVDAVRRGLDRQVGDALGGQTGPSSRRRRRRPAWSGPAGSVADRACRPR